MTLLAPFILILAAYVLGMPLISYAIDALAKKNESEFVIMLPKLPLKRKKAILFSYYLSTFCAWAAIIYLLFNFLM